MPKPISLDGLRMNVVETGPNGVVNKDTVFSFRHRGDVVTAEYSGGEIAQGYLVGKLDKDNLVFRYAQLHEDGALDGGVSHCEVTVGENGTTEIVERFEWESRDGGGVNVFREI